MISLARRFSLRDDFISLSCPELLGGRAAYCFIVRIGASFLIAFFLHLLFPFSPEFLRGSASLFQRLGRVEGSLLRGYALIAHLCDSIGGGSFGRCLWRVEPNRELLHLGKRSACNVGRAGRKECVSDFGKVGDRNSTTFGASFRLSLRSSARVQPLLLGFWREINDTLSASREIGQWAIRPAPQKQNQINFHLRRNRTSKAFGKFNLGNLWPSISSHFQDDVVFVGLPVLGTSLMLKPSISATYADIERRTVAAQKRIDIEVGTGYGSVSHSASQSRRLIRGAMSGANRLAPCPYATTRMAA